MNASLRSLAICLLIVAAGLSPCVQFSEKTEWQNAKWSAPDTEFRQARSRIEKLGAAPCVEELRSLLKGMDSDRAPTPLKLFQWMTLCRAAIRLNPDFSDELKRNRAHQRAFSTLAANLQPHSYEFTRAVFVHVVTFHFPHPNHLPLGRRLIAKNPDDLAVTLAQVKLLQPQVRPAEKAYGIELIKSLDRLKKEPYPGLEYRVGYFYYLAWYKSKDLKDRKEAESRLNKVLAISTSKSQKQNARKVLSWIKEESWLGIKPKAWSR